MRHAFRSFNRALIFWVIVEVHIKFGLMDDGVISAWERREAEAQPSIRLFRTSVPRITTSERYCV
jgi:hypothetical protein